MADNNGSAAVLENAAPAQSQDVKRDATQADGLSAMTASVSARKHKSAASKAFRSCFANMRAGNLEQAIEQLADHLRDTQARVQAISALPNGVTIKGGASKNDLLVDICGFEQKKAVTDRVKKSIAAYRLDE